MSDEVLTISVHVHPGLVEHRGGIDAYLDKEIAALRKLAREKYLERFPAK